MTMIALGPFSYGFEKSDHLLLVAGLSLFKLFPPFLYFLMPDDNGASSSITTWKISCYIKCVLRYKRSTVRASSDENVVEKY